MQGTEWALVTGAGSPSGIGFAIAKALGATGRPVAITSTTERIHERVAELRALGVEARGQFRPEQRVDIDKWLAEHAYP